MKKSGGKRSQKRTFIRDTNQNMSVYLDTGAELELFKALDNASVDARLQKRVDLLSRKVGEEAGEITQGGAELARGTESDALEEVRSVLESRASARDSLYRLRLSLEEDVGFDTEVAEDTDERLVKVAREGAVPNVGDLERAGEGVELELGRADLDDLAVEEWVDTQHALSASESNLRRMIGVVKRRAKISGRNRGDEKRGTRTNLVATRLNTVTPPARTSSC